MCDMICTLPLSLPMRFSWFVTDMLLLLLSWRFAVDIIVDAFVVALIETVTAVLAVVGSSVDVVIIVFFCCLPIMYVSCIIHNTAYIHKSSSWCGSSLPVVTKYGNYKGIISHVLRVSELNEPSVKSDSYDDDDICVVVSTEFSA